MKIQFKNLLPGKILKRVALASKSFNMSPGLSFKFHRLIIIFLLAGFLSGYYPALTFPPVKKSVAHAQNELKAEIIAASFASPPVLPHPGYLSTRFSNYHPGIDIASGLGMPVHPINPGVVIEVIYNFFDYGNHVVIDHGNGFKSLYAHMGRVYVKKGDKVSSSSIIGDVGLTGRTSGPHTHLEVTKNGAYIDPLTILPTIPDMPTVPPTIALPKYP